MGVWCVCVFLRPPLSLPLSLALGAAMRLPRFFALILHGPSSSNFALIPSAARTKEKEKEDSKEEEEEAKQVWALQGMRKKRGQRCFLVYVYKEDRENLVGFGCGEFVIFLVRKIQIQTNTHTRTHAPHTKEKEEESGGGAHYRRENA